MTYNHRMTDKYDRVIKQDGEKLRPIDGNNISQKSRDSLKKAINNDNFGVALEEIFHILTGEEVTQ
jgi:hypothetical protein